MAAIITFPEENMTRKVLLDRCHIPHSRVSQATMQTPPSSGLYLLSLQTLLERANDQSDKHKHSR